MTVASSRNDLESLSAAVGVHDAYGIAEILARGGCFNVVAGTRVLVIDSGYLNTVAVSRIRILSGSRAGRSGWVTSEILVTKGSKYAR